MIHTLATSQNCAPSPKGPQYPLIGRAADPWQS
jgi:hypothetical protein